MPRATRSISVFMIAMFAVTGLAFAGTAGASTPATKASTSACIALEKKFSKVESSTAKDTSDPKALSKTAGRISGVFKSMAKSAPGSLKGSFNRLAKAYASLKDIDFTNPASVKKLGTFGNTIGKDLAKVGKYFTTCKR